MKDDVEIPEGEDYLQFLWSLEDKCQLQTDRRMPELGKKAPECWKHLGTVLSLLDRMASCWWKCRGGDHKIEYLCGRAASSAGAVVRLIRHGYYDEALVLSRGLGEIANLMHLFSIDARSLDEWTNAAPLTVRREFSPVKVRRRLESLSTTPLIKEDRYSLLSTRAVHVHPDTTPQNHNVLGIPVLGAQLQDEGILVCVNEIALPLGIITTFGAVLLELERELVVRIVSSARDLAEQLGAANITEIDRYFERLPDHLTDKSELENLKRLLSNYELQLAVRPSGRSK